MAPGRICEPLDGSLTASLTYTWTRPATLTPMSCLGASTTLPRLNHRCSRPPQHASNADAADTEEGADFQGYPG